MNRIFIMLFLAVFLSACSESSTQNNLSDDLTQIENEWMHAMMKRDKSMLDQVVASEFTVTGMNYIDSAAVTRSVWMQNVLQDMKIDSVRFLKTKVQKVGDVGIVRAQMYWSGAYGQDRFSDTTSFVDTWIKRGGGWRVVSRVVTD